VTQNLELLCGTYAYSKGAGYCVLKLLASIKEIFAERGAEVGGMKAIFSRASQVIVRLGPESELSNLAVDTLRRIRQAQISGSGCNSYWI
jgi:hypothetical protein